jgi:hypothetical protein
MVRMLHVFITCKRHKDLYEALIRTFSKIGFTHVILSIQYSFLYYEHMVRLLHVFITCKRHKDLYEVLSEFLKIYFTYVRSFAKTILIFVLHMLKCMCKCNGL